MKTNKSYYILCGKSSAITSLILKKNKSIMQKWKMYE